MLPTYKKYIKIIETDNQIKIKCLYNELLVGTNFVLECKDSLNNNNYRRCLIWALMTI